MRVSIFGGQGEKYCGGPEHGQNSKKQMGENIYSHETQQEYCSPSKNCYRLNVLKSLFKPKWGFILITFLAFRKN